MSEPQLKLGLLMEAAEAHQRLAEEGLRRLEAHTEGLDAVVREEIRRTLVDELAQVFAESTRAAHALRSVGRGAQLRTLSWTVLVTTVASLVPLAVLHALVPSPSEIRQLEDRREALRAALQRLQGVDADLRRCGGRLCVRVDKQGGAWGERADYFILGGRGG
jgi:hypothetical protein